LESGVAELSGRKVAIIGTGGLGQAIVLEAARREAELILFDRQPLDLTLERELHALGSSFSHCLLDVRRVPDIAVTFSTAFKNTHIDSLIYLPRAREERDFLKTTPGSWDEDLDTALRGAFFTVQAAYPFLQKSPGGGGGTKAL
jgi:NAD(P)-dependent dehydrogenase (short-subunit alcohol dehydrogenase family)